MDTPSTPTQGPANRSAPPGVFIPVLPYPEVAAAVKWLCDTFGFVERLRIGDHRSQLVFRGASVVIGASPERVIGSQSVMVRVPDVDRHFEHAKQHGAKILRPPRDFPYGERQYTVEDFAGYRWTFTQSVADVDPKDWGGVLVNAEVKEP